MDNSKTNVELNTLVLFIEDNVRLCGRVVAIHPKADGRVRVVTVKTATGCYKRAVKKMCPYRCWTGAMMLPKTRIGLEDSKCLHISFLC